MIAAPSLAWLAGAAVAGGLLVGTIYQQRLNVWEARAEASETRASMAEAANTQCQADVTEARLAVGRVLQDAKDREALAALAVAEAQKQAAHHATQAEYWRKRQPSSADQCAAAADALDEYMKARR